MKRHFRFLAILLAMISFFFQGCEPNPYALSNEDIIAGYNGFIERNGPAIDDLVARFPRVAADIEANLQLAVDSNWTLSDLKLEGDSRGEIMKINDESYPTFNPEYNFFSLPVSVLHGQFPKGASQSTLSEGTLMEYMDIKENGYEVSSGPPYTPEGRTIQFMRDTMAAYRMVKARYLGVLYPISEETGQKLDYGTFEGGSFVGAAFIYDLKEMKVLDGFLFSAINSDEVSYSSAWGDDPETIAFVLEGDLRDHVRGNFYRGIGQRCKFEY